MKVSEVKKEKEFVPVQILLESREELECLFHISCLTVTIPKELERAYSEDRQLAEIFLNILRAELRKIRRKLIYAD